MLETRKKRLREARACTPIVHKNFSDSDSERVIDYVEEACCNCPTDRKGCFKLGFCFLFLFLGLSIAITLTIVIL